MCKHKLKQRSVPVNLASENISPRTRAPRQAPGFSFEVRELYGRWRVEENGESVAAFERLEDAIPLALLYAQARNEGGNPAVVFVRGHDGAKVRVAQFGALKPFAVTERLAS